MYTFMFPVTIRTRDNAFYLQKEPKMGTVVTEDKCVQFPLLDLNPCFGASNASTVTYAYMYILSMHFFILPGQSRL